MRLEVQDRQRRASSVSCLGSRGAPRSDAIWCGREGDELQRRCVGVHRVRSRSRGSLSSGAGAAVYGRYGRAAVSWQALGRSSGSLDARDRGHRVVCQVGGLPVGGGADEARSTVVGNSLGRLVGGPVPVMRDAQGLK
ncbi:unnamed protein product [Gadus morhua 'NCC']